MESKKNLEPVKDELTVNERFQKLKDMYDLIRDEHVSLLQQTSDDKKSHK